ncbi:MAG: hypothetical protein KY432_10025 [Acidobacteria bacterium]|nr:hypothetical protein [Acidobacteriota bacterium]
MKCSAPDCDAEIEIPFDPAPGDAQSSAYDEQRSVIARNHGWVMGRDSESGSLLQFCPTHRSGSIAGFAPF